MADTLNPLASPDFSDIAETDSAEPTTAPQATQLDLSQASPVPESALQQAAQTENEQASAKLQDRIKFEKAKRLQRIREDQSLMDSRLRFVLESAGIERLQQSYSLPGGFSHVVFYTISNEDMVSVANQAPRDIQQGRWQYDVEGQTLIAWYRLCCSIRSFEVRDPVKGQTIRKFERGDWQSRFGVVDPKKPSIDLLPRRLYDHMMSEVFVTKTLAMTVYNQFMAFENMMNDLAFLLEHDPDFFYAGLTSN